MYKQVNQLRVHTRPRPPQPRSRLPSRPCGPRRRAEPPPRAAAPAHCLPDPRCCLRVTATLRPSHTSLPCRSTWLFYASASLYWSAVDLQRRVSFHYTTKRISGTHTCVHSCRFCPHYRAARRAPCAAR